MTFRARLQLTELGSGKLLTCYTAVLCNWLISCGVTKMGATLLTVICAESFQSSDTKYNFITALSTPSDCPKAIASFYTNHTLFKTSTSTTQQSQALQHNDLYSKRS